MTPISEYKEPEEIKPTTQAICITEEKAMIALISEFETPLKKDIIDPTHATAVKKNIIGVRDTIVLTKWNPYAPAFNMIPANIILPTKGEKTWAKGSQRWKPQIGSFTKNVILNLKYKILPILLFRIRGIKDDSVFIEIIIPEIKKGKEAITVYSNIYKDDLIRSGSIPIIKINPAIGNNILSYEINITALDVVMKKILKKKDRINIK